MKEIHWVLKDTTYSIAAPQPGLFILTTDSYATMWTPTREPRVPFKSLSQPTDEEKIAGFGSIVFNSGTYTKTDSTLTTTALIAKVPGFEGGVQYYRYNILEGVLELTMFDETYPDGEKPEWFGQVESKFVYQRMSVDSQ